jgi:hypothetical protein
VVVVAAILALTVSPGATLAQTPEPRAPTTIAPGAIPVQGKLTDASGAPLSGTYTMYFRLYEAADAVTDLCLDVRDVVVTNGLFNDVIDHCYDNIHGQKVWLGIQVSGDDEMTPRQPIYPATYALGLVPGYVMDTAIDSPLTLKTSHATGTGLTVQASHATGINYGINASSNSSAGYAGYFYNYSSGTGLSGISFGGTGIYAGSLVTALVASSATGTAISAEGTGKIKSTAKSYVWVSGNNVRAFNATDKTVFNMNSQGGVRVQQGTTATNKDLVLPITITGPLYGQDVSVTGLDIYFAGLTSFDAIVVMRLRRATGVCPTCYATIQNDTTSHVCVASENANGCIIHYDLTSNNVLSDTSGILYLTLQLAFNSGTSWVDIGGIRLTLEHD